jgi:hypothetical protein
LPLTMGIATLNPSYAAYALFPTDTDNPDEQA